MIDTAEIGLDLDKHPFLDSEKPNDYIILNDVLGESSDICTLLYHIRIVSKPSTRVIIVQHNYLWGDILSATGKLGLKDREKTQNWLSIEDIKSYLNSMGFELIRSFRNTVFPLKLGFLGPFFNTVSNCIPFSEVFKLDQFLIARPTPRGFSIKNDGSKSLTICITVRDEKENIEPIVKSLPILVPQQEVLFVEGHSKDGTREEIERLILKYPEKNIRVVDQPGIGQGNAIRVGFKEARGEIIILYEGDDTSEPGDIIHFYNAINSGVHEFVEGSRFVYPLKGGTMPFLNKIGNIFFAKWFSWFLGQRVTDILGGIKAISKKDFQEIHNNWGFLGIEDPFGDFELLFGAVRNGLKIGEIPMHYGVRTYGSSKSKVITHGFILLKMAFFGYWTFRNFNQRKK